MKKGLSTKIWFSSKDVAALAGVAPKTLVEWINSGDITKVPPYHRTSPEGIYRYDRDAVRTWLWRRGINMDEQIRKLGLE